MSKRFLLLSMVALLLLSGAAAFSGEKPDLPQAQTRVTEVAIFKDGYGFFVRSGKTRLENGWAAYDIVPNAVMGTVWVFTDKANEPVDLLVRSTREIKKTEKIGDFNKLMLANIGAKVVVTTYNNVRIAGTLVSALTENSGSEATFVIKTLEGTYSTVRFGNIQQVEFADEPNLEKPAAVEKKPTLRAKILTNRDEATLGLAYLEQGLSWLPSYLVILKDDKTAIVSLRATLVNDAEDLENTDLRLVVGVPHFSAKGQLDPVGIQGALAATGEFTGMPARPMMSKGAFSADMRAEAAPAPPPVGELAGEEMEELYLYHKDNISLKKGERVQIVLMTGEAPYQNIYSWEADAGNEVWYSLKLTNNLKAPWTNGLALSVKGEQPLGQDMLDYTPVGASTNLKVTQAPGVRVSQQEREISRSQPEKMADAYWAIVTMKGELKIENYKKDTVELEVKKTVTGKVEFASDNGEITAQPRSGVVQPWSYEGLNPTTNLKWKLPVTPGKDKILIYQYKVYVRV